MYSFLFVYLFVSWIFKYSDVTVVHIVTVFFYVLHSSMCRQTSSNFLPCLRRLWVLMLHSAISCTSIKPRLHFSVRCLCVFVRPGVSCCESQFHVALSFIPEDFSENADVRLITEDRTIFVNKFFRAMKRVWRVNL